MPAELDGPGRCRSRQVDYHDQGAYVAADGDMITTSIFWPNASGVPAPALTLSKQMSVVINDTLTHYGFADQPVPGHLAAQ